MLDYVWLLLILPLLGALVNALFGARLPRRAVGWIACGAVGLAFVAALAFFFSLGRLPPEERHLEVQLWRWIDVEQFDVEIKLLYDSLSAWMAVVVTGVSFLIHIYSVGYMAEDARYSRYFAFLNGFVFMMLLLVLSSNFVMMYVGWEGVGLASYLLIGFWFERKSAADAGKKAFLVNRIGDFGMAIAIFWIWHIFRTTHFDSVFGTATVLFQAVPGGQTGAINIITLLLLLAATGKSAQIPLHVWLPDAMEGPTPVSALIHAATMVTAGVYMIARCSPLFELASSALTWVAVIGALTAFFAATIALTQTDLKRILAYSTISQLGYMFLGVGVGAYTAGIFHLTTHAFFKALLFLAAGSVMHALHGELDIRKMGGLREKLPSTYRVFLIGAAALAGFPLLSGFFSKDEILWQTWQKYPLLWVVGIVTALLTAIYSFRAVFVPFWGEYRGRAESRRGKKARRQEPEVHGEIHESPSVMTGPMWVLAALAVAGGLLGLPRLSFIEEWMKPVLVGHHIEPGITQWVFLVISAAVSLLGIVLAHRAYVVNRAIPEAVREHLGVLYRLVANKYYVDEIYMALIVNPLRGLADWFSQVGDGTLIEGVVNGLASIVGFGGEQVRRVQTGFVGTYALSLLLGAVALLGYFLLR